MSSSTPDQRAGEEEEEKKYECGCHCGFIKFAMTLSPPLPAYEVLQCNCSACTRFGYLLVYPLASQIQWHDNGRDRCAVYRFNTKEKDQLFCPKCGASLAIDFRDVHKPHQYGISVRSIYGINLDELKYKKLDGINRVSPAGDLSGHYWDEETGQMK